MSSMFLPGCRGHCADAMVFSLSVIFFFGRLIAASRADRSSFFLAIAGTPRNPKPDLGVDFIGFEAAAEVCCSRGCGLAELIDWFCILLSPGRLSASSCNNLLSSSGAPLPLPCGRDIPDVRGICPGRAILVDRAVRSGRRDAS